MIQQNAKVSLLSFKEKVRRYSGTITSDHHRYRSWEHCFSFFQRMGQNGLRDCRDTAALHLAFYLASWGMYRGSSFLLQHAYTIHLQTVDILASADLSPLWKHEFGASDDDEQRVPAILHAIEEIRAHYQPLAAMVDSGGATDTLITKILLGTVGCVPACDRYFIHGFRRAHFCYSSLGEKFLLKILAIARENSRDLTAMKKKISSARSARYPVMKLLDMYFWQLGYEAEMLKKGAESKVD